MRSPRELDVVLEDFYQKLVQYEAHLKKAGSFNPADKAEPQRKALSETWGEISPEVAALGVSLGFEVSGKPMATFENALRPQTAISALPITLIALPFAKQAIENARGRLKAVARSASSRPKQQPQATPASRRVFVVHGHDRALLNEVARFLGSVGLEPVVLEEKPHGGRTLIEKFEAYADVSYAIVLLTPDDLARPVVPETAPLRPRARQNVVLEWGFFMGKRGRGRVAVLYTGEVERPTDIEGLAYIPADNESWKLNLMRELRHSGFSLAEEMA